MTQNVFSGLTGSIGLLNANFTEVYTVYNVFNLVSGVLTATVDVNISKASPTLRLNKSAAAQYITFDLQSGTLPRWQFGVNNTAETGSDAGSDFFLNHFNDAGAYVATAMTVKRSTGHVAIGGGTGIDWTGGFARLAVLSNNSTGRTVSAYNSHNSAGSALAARVDNVACRLAEFFYTATAVGTITTNATTTAYNTSSDRRLKQDIAPAGDFGAVIDAIQVRNFTWKIDGSVCRAGFIAQELSAVVPEAVSAGDTDPDEIQVSWGVDAAKLVPFLVAELQAVRRRLAALEAAAA